MLRTVAKCLLKSAFQILPSCRLNSWVRRLSHYHGAWNMNGTWFTQKISLRQLTSNGNVQGPSRSGLSLNFSIVTARSCILASSFLSMILSHKTICKCTVLWRRWRFHRKETMLWCNQTWNIFTYDLVPDWILYLLMSTQLLRTQRAGKRRSY
jgi:hypothetical protein